MDSDSACGHAGGQEAGGAEGKGEGERLGEGEGEPVRVVSVRVGSLSESSLSE